MEKEKKIKREPTLAESIIVILALVFFVSIGFGLCKFELQAMLLCTAIFTVFMSMRLGLTWEMCEKAISQRVVKVMPIVYIMFTVGGLIAVLIFSGTIPMLIYYGLQIVKPHLLLPCSFLVCCVLSIVTGTGWGSAGTAGIALIGIAIGMDMPLAPVAACVVAGATFGDKLSPMSDTTLLAALSAGTGLYDHIRSMLYTTIPAALISLVLYTVYGLRFGADAAMPESVTSMISTLDSIYNWNLLLLLPFAIIFVGALMKKPTLPVMYLAIGVGLVLGVIFQGFSLQNGFTAFATGFKVELAGIDSTVTDANILTLLQRGGLSSMSNIVLTIFCAYSYAGISEEAGFMEKIIDSAVARIKTRGGTVLAAVCTAVVLTIIGVSGYISLIMTGELWRKPYLKQRMDLCNLSRTCEDGGTMVCSCVPFSTSGLFYATALGVPVLAYAPWHFMAFLCPVLAVIYGFTGFGIKMISEEEANMEMERLGFKNDEERMAQNEA